MLIFLAGIVAMIGVIVAMTVAMIGTGDHLEVEDASPNQYQLNHHSQLL